MSRLLMTSAVSMYSTMNELQQTFGSIVSARVYVDTLLDDRIGASSQRLACTCDQLLSALCAVCRPHLSCICMAVSGAFELAAPYLWEWVDWFDTAERQLRGRRVSGVRSGGSGEEREAGNSKT